MAQIQHVYKCIYVCVYVCVSMCICVRVLLMLCCSIVVAKWDTFTVYSNHAHGVHTQESNVDMTAPTQSPSPVFPLVTLGLFVPAPLFIL